MERKVQSFRVTDDVSHKHQQHGCHQDTGFVMPVLPKWTGRRTQQTPRLNVFRQVPNGAERQTSAALCSGYRASEIHAAHLTKHFLML